MTHVKIGVVLDTGSLSDRSGFRWEVKSNWP